jgi:hypothetical protein
MSGKVNFGNSAAPKRPLETFDGHLIKPKTPETQPLFCRLAICRSLCFEQVRRIFDKKFGRLNPAPQTYYQRRKQN